MSIVRFLIVMDRVVLVEELDYETNDEDDVESDGDGGETSKLSVRTAREHMDELRRLANKVDLHLVIGRRESFFLVAGYFSMFSSHGVKYVVVHITFTFSNFFSNDKINA